MTIQEIQKLVKQIKMLLPIIQIQELDNKSEEEIKDILAIYIMQFGNLNYQITLKALNNITQNDSKMKEFKQAPIPTLARESTKLTVFSEQEKKIYKISQEIKMCHYPAEHTMVAFNKLTGKRMKEYDRPLTNIEEDYYNNYLMTQEEYWYWVDKEKGLEPVKPKEMHYNPKTRKNDLSEKDFVLEGFKSIGDM